MSAVRPSTIGFALLVCGAMTSAPAHAGRVNLCNTTGRPIRVIMLNREGLQAVIQQNLTVYPPFELADQACRLLGGDGWFLGVIHGLLAIEQKEPAEDFDWKKQLAELKSVQADIDALNAIDEKTAAFVGALPFYDRLMLYFPHSRQSRSVKAFTDALYRKADEEQSARKKRDAERLARSEWSFTLYDPYVKPEDVKNEQGAQATRLEVCLPEAYSTFVQSGKLPMPPGCPAGQRPVTFSVAFGVGGRSTLDLTVYEGGMRTQMTTQ